jgi:hypothetical protein
MLGVVTKHNAVFKLEKANVVVLMPVYNYIKKKKRLYRLGEEIRVELFTGLQVVIPKGYETDISSTPFWLWSIVPPMGDFSLAAIIHDYCYSSKCVTRYEADREMLLWSNLINRNKFDNYVRYYSVRAFGWLVWRNIINLW